MKRAACTLFGVVTLAACTGSPSTASQDGGADARADAPADVADVPADRAPPPYDAGVAPACTVSAFTRHVADQSPGVEVLEVGGLVRVADNFVLAVRQGVSRLSPPDGAPARRDTVDVMSVTSLGFPASELSTVYDSTPAGTDLSPPSVVRAGNVAMLLLRESRGLQGQSDYTTHIRGTLLDLSASPMGPAISLDDRGDPFATTLPDGSVFLLSSRVVSRNDAGFLVASPNSVRIGANGVVVDPVGADLSSVVPIEADSVMMRPTSTGAALVFRRLADLRVVRFDAAGVVDTRIHVTPNVQPARLDDGAAFDQGVIVAWDDPTGTMHSIHVAVTDAEGALLTHQVVERYEAAGSPVINAAAVHGGAAIMWIRGAGDSAMLRGMVMQPNGVMHAPPLDLLPVPGADGRMFSVGEGRSLTFVARDRGPRGYGLTFGRLCLPE